VQSGHPGPSFPPSGIRLPPGTARTWLLAFVLLVALPVLQACGQEDAGPEEGRETISAEAFVDAYVALRLAALRAPREELDLSEKARILEERNLTDEDLLRFVEVHGTDIPFMHDVWQEVDSLLRAAREGENPARS